jgi:hypothetical protein
MSAGAILPTHSLDRHLQGEVVRRVAARRAVDVSRAVRNAEASVDAGVVVLIGFLAALGWAFAGSLLLGLGSGSASQAVAWLWLAGESLIGVAVFAALLLDAPPGRGDDA